MNFELKTWRRVSVVAVPCIAALLAQVAGCGSSETVPLPATGGTDASSDATVPDSTDAATTDAASTDSSPTDPGPTADAGVAPDAGGNDADPDGGQPPLARPPLTKEFGGSGDHYVIDVQLSPQDDTLLVGHTQDSINFGNKTLVSQGGRDVAIAKLDRNGTPVFAALYGDSADQFGVHGAFDPSGNVGLVSWNTGTVDFGGGSLKSAGLKDSVITKFDPQGKYIWAIQFGDAADQLAESIKFDAAGNAFVTGYFYGSITLGSDTLTDPTPGTADAFLAKFDPQGKPLWAKSFGDAKDQYAFDLSVDKNGDAAISGYFSGALDFGGGTTLTQVTGKPDAWVAKFSGSDGKVKWARAFGDEDDQRGAHVAFDPSGDLFFSASVGGSVDMGGAVGILKSAGSHDVLVSRLAGSDGHTLWGRMFGDAAEQTSGQLVSDIQGGLLATANFAGTMTFDATSITAVGTQDIAAVRLNSATGAAMAVRHGSGPGTKTAYGAAAARGNTYLCGIFNGQLDFGGGADAGGVVLTASSDGGTDSFYARLKL